MSLIDTSFDDAAQAPSPTQPLKVEPLISSSQSIKPVKTEDLLNDFNNNTNNTTTTTTASPQPPNASSFAKGVELDDLMSFSPVVQHKA